MANVLTPAQIASAAKAAGFTGIDLVTAVAVAEAESSGDASQITPEPNGTKSYGLWQINSVHQQVLASGNWADPVANAQMAFTIWQQSGGGTQGWHPWSTYKNGAYKKNLGIGMAAAGNPVAIPAANTPVTASGAVLVSAPGPANPVQSVIDSLHFLSDSHNWIRMAEFLGGGLLLVIGFGMIFDLKGKAKVVADKATEVVELAAVA